MAECAIAVDYRRESVSPLEKKTLEFRLLPTISRYQSGRNGQGNKDVKLDPVKMYLLEISQYPLLKREEEFMLAKRLSVAKNTLLAGVFEYNPSLEMIADSCEKEEIEKLRLDTGGKLEYQGVIDSLPMYAEQFRKVAKKRTEQILNCMQKRKMIRFCKE